MRDLEKKLLQEIRNQFSSSVLMEDVQDFIFAVIEPELPKEGHREYETYIRVYGEKQATIRGRGGVRTVKYDLWVDRSTGQREIVTHSTGKAPKQKMPNPERIEVWQPKCPMCGDEPLTIGKAIKSHIKDVQNEIDGVGGFDDFTYKVGLQSKADSATGKKKQNLENTISTLRSDINYLEDALTRYTKSGKADEVVECPACTGWQWEDIPQYKNDSGEYDPKRAGKYPTPWEMFIDWLWETLSEAGLSPMQGSGFANSKDKYGKDRPVEPEGKKGHIYPRKDIIIIVESLGESLAQIHKNLGEILLKSKTPFFTIVPFPDEEIKDKFDSAVAMHKMDADQSAQADNIERWVDNNRVFYVRTRIKESRYGEELGLPEYEITTPLDMSKLLDEVKPTKTFQCKNGHTWEVRKDWLKDNKVKKMVCARCAADDSVAKDEEGNPIDEKGRIIVGKPVNIPMSVGDVPPREGEWWTYGTSIKKPGAALRKARSAAAHQTHLGTKEEIRARIRAGQSFENLRDDLVELMQEKAVEKGRTATPEMVDRYISTLSRVYKEIKKEEDELAAELAAADYPGSKYAHWDKEIEHLADALGSDPVTIELAVSKYLDTLDEFPQPFDFDRLSTNDAVRALNTLIAIEPDEIDSLIPEAADYLNDLSRHKMALLEDKAKCMVSDLGCSRANAIYGALREIKETKLKPMLRDPLYRSSREFYATFNKANEMFGSLLECALPLCKVSDVAPVVEDAPALDSSAIEFWDNIFGRHAEIDPIVATNSNKLANFYRQNVDKNLLESLWNMRKNGSSPMMMARILNSSVSGRDASL